MFYLKLPNAIIPSDNIDTVEATDYDKVSIFSKKGREYSIQTKNPQELLNAIVSRMGYCMASKYIVHANEPKSVPYGSWGRMETTFTLKNTDFIVDVEILNGNL